MNVSFLTPSRTVLLTADDALYIYLSGAKGVELVEAVPWEAENFAGRCARIIKQDCGGKSILILNDMVEQHYRKERVPSVSIMDKAGVVKRKLLVAFPNYPTRAALPLKEKLKNPISASKGSIYIFSAVPDSNQLTKTADVARLSSAEVNGFGLLPVESASMVKALSNKVTKKGETRSTWSIFIGQHKNGSVRQVVTKNGELALTRMTPIVETDEDPERWVSDVQQEFTATMSYLARFGYSEAEGLDVIVIANSNCSELLQQELEGTLCNLRVMDAVAAAKLLGINIGVQTDARYADPLHIAWSSRKSKLTLPMRSKEVDAVMRPRQMAMTASAAMLLLSGYVGYQLYQHFPRMNELKGRIEIQEKERRVLNVEYDEVFEQKEAIGFDITLVKNALSVYQELEEQDINALALFSAIGEALGRKMNVETLMLARTPEEIEKKDPYAQPEIQYDEDGNPLPGPPLYSLEVSFRYPGTTDVIAGNKQVNEFKDRLQSLLPENKVFVSKFLKDFGYTQNFVIETGVEEKAEVGQEFVARVMVEGPGT